MKLILDVTAPGFSQEEESQCCCVISLDEILINALNIAKSNMDDAAARGVGVASMRLKMGPERWVSEAWLNISESTLTLFDDDVFNFTGRANKSTALVESGKVKLNDLTCLLIDHELPNDWKPNLWLPERPAPGFILPDFAAFSPKTGGEFLLRQYATLSNDSLLHMQLEALDSSRRLLDVTNDIEIDQKRPRTRL